MTGVKVKDTAEVKRSAFSASDFDETSVRSRPDCRTDGRAL